MSKGKKPYIVVYQFIGEDTVVGAVELKHNDLTDRQMVKVINSITPFNGEKVSIREVMELLMTFVVIDPAKYDHWCIKV